MAEAKLLCRKILGQQGVVFLEPSRIFIDEAAEAEKVRIDFSFFQKEGLKSELVELTNTETRGFVQAVFNSCLKFFVPAYPSLENVGLSEFLVRAPSQLSLNRDKLRKANICFILRIKNYGTVDFVSEHNSLVFSSFRGVLNIFEFYINCERSFQRLRFAYDDAKKRNRADIEQECQFNMGELTRFNQYTTQSAPK